MSDGPCPVEIAELVEQFAELLYRYAYRLTGNAADAGRSDSTDLFDRSTETKSAPRLPIR